MDKDFDEAVDLSKYSIEDSCLWLLRRLEADKYENQPYTRPYCNYVMSWPKAIPLNAIIMAQSPYPNPIFPEVAAAMSFDREKCRQLMKADSPPTVRILANDLRIHTGMNPEDVDAIVMNGWSLVSSGILLVNSAVFCPYGTAGAYNECMNQVNVLVRMLVETEKYGNRKVDIIAYGAGQAMASELTKCFKSDVVKLTRFTSTHPASLSYRMTNFTSPECHMDAPSTSRTLAKHFSNQVAYVHTMAKKSDSELRVQRQLDTIRSLGKQLQDLKEESEKLFPAMKNLLKHLDEGDEENLKLTLQQIIHTGDTFTFRLGTASAALSQVQASAGGTGSTVSKAGPSMSTTSPSMQSLSQHVGGEFKAAQSLPPRTISLGRSRNRTSTDAGTTSDMVNVSSPPSVTSVNTEATSTTAVRPTPVAAPRRINIRRSSAPATGTQKTTSASQSKSSEAEKKVESDNDTATVSSVGARLRKLTPILESTPSGNSGNVATDQGPNPEWKLSKEVLHHLSCVDAVIEINAPDRFADDEVSEMLSGIQSDMAAKTAYNTYTQRIAEAIRQDLDADPKFDFSKWCVDTSKTCATYEQCKEEFEF